MEKSRAKAGVQEFVTVYLSKQEIAHLQSIVISFAEKLDSDSMILRRRGLDISHEQRASEICKHLHSRLGEQVPERDSND